MRKILIEIITSDNSANNHLKHLIRDQKAYVIVISDPKEIAHLTRSDLSMSTNVDTKKRRHTISEKGENSTYCIRNKKHIFGVTSADNFSY